MIKKVLITACLDTHILNFHLPFLKMLKEDGYEVHVATNGKEEIPYCDVKHEVSFRKNIFNMYNIDAIFQLRKIMKENHFEIIHANTTIAGIVTRIAAISERKKGTKIIYNAHGFEFHKHASKIKWAFYYPIEYLLSYHTDTLITINSEDYHLALKSFKAKEIEYLPGIGLDKEKFQFELSEEEKKKYRLELVLSNQDFVILYPAELNQNKNQAMLIRAMELVIKKFPQVKLLLPGDDSMNGYYHKLVRECDVANHVEFLGYRKDIQNMMKISDLVVSTSKSEGLPMEILDAMVCGLPIIVTNTRGNKDLIENYVNGFLVEVGDYQKLAQCIETVIATPGLKETFQIGNQKKLAEYDLEKVVSKMEQIYFGEEYTESIV